MYETFPGSPASKGELQFNMWGLTDDETPSNRQKDEGLMKNIQKYSVDVANDQGYNWDALRERIKASGMRNSLLVAPMPTASTSQILGVNECFEPFVSNLYLRRVKAGEVRKQLHIHNKLSSIAFSHNEIFITAVYYGQSTLTSRPD